VFDGEKQSPYVEEDQIHPIEWYGQTKAWAEDVVTKADIPYTIFRIDQPYRQDEFPKLDILHRIKKGLEENTLPPMFTDHTFTATKIEKFAEILHFAIQHPLQGIFHATTDPVMSDYEFALKVKEQFHLDGEVKQGSLVEFLKTTQRPYQKNTALDTTKLKKAMAL
jgi:dTDP-4-dehydrorhamnose reductase